MAFNTEQLQTLVYPFAGSDPETDIMLFFTDNKNEPRAINVRRCIETDEQFTGNPFGYTGEELQDFICACPRVPVKPIQFEFESNTNDDAVELESNFKNSDGLIFAYQNVSKNGYVSSLSSFSKAAYPPAIASLGSRSPEELSISNTMLLSIPKQNNEVSSIRILYKEGDGGVWNLIDQVNAIEDVNNVNYTFVNDEEIAGVYRFYKERIYPVIALSESSKNFDKLPAIAQSQAVSGNRLMYGNYEEGFDQVSTSSTSTVVYKDRLADLVTFDIDCNSIMYRGTLSGFTVNTAGLPDDIPPGLYQIRLKFKPTRNIHVYSYKDSYIGSPHRTQNEDTSFDDYFTGEPVIFTGGTTYLNPDGSQMLYDAGGYTDTHKISRNYGTASVSNNPNYSSVEDRCLELFPEHSIENVPTTSWDYAPGIGYINWKNQETGETKISRIGQSPATPLILGIKEIPIDINFEVTETISSSDVSSIIDVLISSSDTTNTEDNEAEQNPPLNAVALVEDQFPVQIINTSGEDTGPIKPEVEINLGLGEPDSISTFSQTSSLAELVCLVNPFDVGQVGGGCGGFFIVNRADVKFRMMKVPVTGSFNQRESVTQSGTNKGYYFKLVSVDTSYNNSLVSCIPKPAMGRGEVGKGPNDTVAFQPNTPWRVLDNNGVVPSGDEVRRLIWPWVRGSQLKTFTGDRLYVAKSAMTGTAYPMPDGMDESIENENGQSQIAEDAVPYRIGSWKIGVQQGTNGVGVDDFYRETINFLEAPQDTQWSYAQTNLVNDYQDKTYVADMNHLLGRKNHHLTSGIIVHDDERLSETWLGNPQNIGGEFITFNLAGSDGSIFNEDNFGNDRLAIVDGDCGPGGRMSPSNPFSDSTIGVDGEPENITTPAFNLGDIMAFTYGGASQFNEGNVMVGASVISSPSQEQASGTAAVHNRFGSVWNTTLLGLVTNMPYIDTTSFYLTNTSSENQSSLSPVREGAFDAAAFDNIQVRSNFASLGDTELSFKTRASHDFGVVYYDKRGRRSSVNKLDSVYVPGYSDLERPGGTKGAVSIQIRLQHAAPSWADRYKIFYSNRNETKRFIQYTAGGAFLEKNSETSKNKIYISLNYLQGSRMSYAQAYGARDKDTDEPTLYRYSKGDTLRLISYYKNQGQREWLPPSYEFKVLGVETLNNLLEDHPLYTDGTISGTNEDLEKLKRNGQFVVVSDNSEAIGFSALDLASQTDHWNQNCVFEIVSKLKESSIEETQPYFETSYGGKVIFSPEASSQLGTPTYIHEQPPSGHLIEEGDVFFRSVPLNFNTYSNGQFQDLISVDEEGNDDSESNFLPYYLETEALTDLYRTTAKGYGKPNLIDTDAFRRKMESSVIFSDKTNQNQFRLRHTSFSDLDQNSFNLPEKHGDLNYIAGEDEYITTLQENKTAVIPVDRSITSTTQGAESVNLSDKVLNSAKFYFGEGGPAGNPESVVEIDGYIYFADKHNKRISRLDPGAQTVENISDLGMEEYFRRQFTRLLDSSNTLDKSDLRIVGGFDPMENEFIVSFLRPADINTEVQEGLSSNTPLTTSLAQLELSSEEPFVNTIAFDHSGGKVWKTRYSFNSSSYSHVNNNLISFKNNQVWDHGKNDKRNKFHGSNYMSMVKPVSVGGDGSMTKVYKSLGLESFYDWPAIIKTHAETATIPTFTNYEGTKYASMPRSKSLSTSNVKSIGVVEEALIESLSSINIKFVSPVSTSLALGDGTIAKVVSNGSILENIDLTPVEKIDSHTITYTFNLAQGAILVNNPIPTGSTILHVGNSSVYGDSLRDKYATIMLLNNSEQEAELYSVNLETSGSKLDTSS